MIKIQVIEPGMLTTVQDLGREGWSASGVVAGGAADPVALRIGNRLVGNSDEAAGLEMTLVGGLFGFEKPATIALTGGDGAAVVESADRTPRYLARWATHRVEAGDRLRIGRISMGVRAYLCVAGGLKVPEVLGSAATHLAAGFGGYEGRALRAGDRLLVGGLCVGANLSAFNWGGESELETLGHWLAQRTLRAVGGAHEAQFDSNARATFWSSEFRVLGQSDRAGLRLAGASVPSPMMGKMRSEGMATGAVQVPENGQPIILAVDHPTTGGYPVMACVASVDLPALGQLGPGDAVRFERVTLEKARTLYLERENWLNQKFLPQERESAPR